MPQLDMPLAELREYQGRNPKPDDFDRYWDDALAEAHAVDPQPELVPADFALPGVECFDLYFTGTGGARVHCKYARPAGKKDVAAVMKFHGYSCDGGDWTELCLWPATGMAACMMEVRGQGGSSHDPGGHKFHTLRGHFIRGLEDSADNLFFRDVFLDTVIATEVVAGFDEVDGDRMGAHGFSQGGALTLACAALSDRIKRAAPVYPFLSDYKRVWEMDLAVKAYDELREFFRWRDPLHEREDEWFRRLGYIDVQHLAPRVDGEVLLGTGLMDNICPPSTVFAAYNKIPGKKDVRIYPDFGHEKLPGFEEDVFTFLHGL